MNPHLRDWLSSRYVFHKGLEIASGSPGKPAPEPMSATSRIASWSIELQCRKRVGQVYIDGQPRLTHTCWGTLVTGKQRKQISQALLLLID
jgi:hypothetical protein